jgi:hypothetical protein
MITAVEGLQRRIWLAVGALVAGVALVACSSDSDSSSSGSKDQYCEALQVFYDTASPYVASTVPPDVGDQLGAELVAAARVAPPRAASALARVLGGDTYARDDFDQYNRSECDIDTSSIRFADAP